jgi:4-hydroxy-tetrahydrodipicolinate synthase
MTTMSSNLGGVITALVTPFQNGEVDKRSFTRLIRQQMDQGVQGFVINGTTGESPTLEMAEVRDLFSLAKSEVAGKVPLIVGAGSNSTVHACELAHEVSSWRPDAILSVVPYYNRPPQRGLVAHFTAIGKASSVPVLLYNVPGRTVANLEPETVGELSRADQIAGIKDATGNMAVLESLKKSVRNGFLLLSGDDASCVEFCAHGGHGVISVSSHIIGREMREAIASKDVNGFKSWFAALMKWLYVEANPIPVKMALHWMKLIESPELRPPLAALDEKFHKDFIACLKELGKIK